MDFVHKTPLTISQHASNQTLRWFRSNQNGELRIRPPSNYSLNISSLTLVHFLYFSILRTKNKICNWCFIELQYAFQISSNKLNMKLPPKADPFHTRPVTNWKGLVEISWPAPATPMTTLCPHPLWQASKAALFKKKIKIL